VEYWIQTGSYKSQTKAEDLAKLLSSKGLPGRVLSFSLNTDTFFRVRIGPYTNKDEAGKFLSIVKQIQGLESSYISSVSATRTVN
jgi:cell division protein FtsN